MTVQLFCPNSACGTKLSIADHGSAQGRKCPRCKTSLVALSLAEEYPVQASESSLSLQKPELPKEIGRYQVRALLGAGAFGMVYRAYDPNLQREVAVKVLHSDLVHGKAAERFLHEAAAQARLQHPHIVPVYDFGKDQDDNRLFLVSALIKGHTLQKELKKTAVDLARSVQVVKQLSEALAYAHKQGIAHRDIKPANILIDEEGKAYLADFGLASLQGGSKLTKLGTPLGTPGYMAPEMAQGAKATGKDVDQYSLGVVLYELLCGELPFTGPSGYVISCHANQEPPSPRQHNPKVPRQLEAICLKAMAKKPEDRFANCQAFADALQHWLDRKTLWAFPGLILDHAVLWCQRQPKQALGSALAIISCLMIALCLSSWFAFRPPTPQVAVNTKQQDHDVPNQSEGAQSKDGPKTQVKLTVSVKEKSTPVTLKKDENTKMKSKTTEPIVQRSLSIQPIAEVQIEPGKSQDILVVVERQNCQGPVEIKLMDLPIGLTSVPVVLADDKQEITLKLTATDQAKPGRFDAKVSGKLTTLIAEKNVSVLVQPAVVAEKITNSLGMQMVWIPPGKFMMGSPPNVIAQLKKDYKYDPFENEGPQHEVTLTKGFYLGKYEVTQEEYEAVMGKNPSWFSANGDGKDRVLGKDTSRFPVECVSWQNATEFCTKLTKQEHASVELPMNEEYRLPTEAEWEYACRGGAKEYKAFHYGDSLSSTQANFNGKSPHNGGAKGPYLERTTKVGEYQPNGFGLYDMHGNVWEWCADWYGQKEYQRGNCKDPSGPLEGYSRVMRGGGFNFIARSCRSAYRFNDTTESRYHSLGFRVARSSVK